MVFPPLDRREIRYLVVLAALASCAGAEPVVITGAMLPGLLGTPVASIRLYSATGVPMPFQVDEVTPQGEYVCDRGREPNTAEGNGLLDSQDEVAFLREDATPAAECTSGVVPDGGIVPVTIGQGGDQRKMVICADPTREKSSRRLISYDSATETIRTPYYYAQFGRRRFHFVRAGIAGPVPGDFTDLTRELRIRIFLRALGVIPIEYDEENIVCVVKRYKIGPVRLIRRGDFHLNLGLWVKGSRAAVNQICYPQAVGVPVFVHLPVRFRGFFSEAFIEMTPVMTSRAGKFVFDVPGRKINLPLGGKPRIDTLAACNPNREFFAVHDTQRGFGWLLMASLPDSLLGGSGFVMQRPSRRGGIAQCGFRLTLRDAPKGDHLIANWVVFSDQGPAGLRASASAIATPATIGIAGRGTVRNALTTVHRFR